MYNVCYNVHIEVKNMTMLEGLLKEIKEHENYKKMDGNRLYTFSKSFIDSDIGLPRNETEISNDIIAAALALTCLSKKKEPTISLAKTTAAIVRKIEYHSNCVSCPASEDSFRNVSIYPELDPLLKYATIARLKPRLIKDNRHLLAKSLAIGIEADENKTNINSDRINYALLAARKAFRVVSDTNCSAIAKKASGLFGIIEEQSTHLKPLVELVEKKSISNEKEK